MSVQQGMERDEAKSGGQPSEKGEMRTYRRSVPATDITESNRWTPKPVSLPKEPWE